MSPRSKAPQIVKSNITIEDARIGYRNFSGTESDYNRKGDRNFAVFFDDPELVDRLAKDGWNIKLTKPRDPEDSPVPFLPITVAYGRIPPKVVLINGRGQTILDEGSVNILDYAEIEHVDLIVRPYNWEVNGKSGVKAYLKTAYITVHEDEIEKKYRNVPMSSDDDSPPWEE